MGWLYCYKIVSLTLLCFHSSNRNLCKRRKVFYEMTLKKGFRLFSDDMGFKVMENIYLELETTLYLSIHNKKTGKETRKQNRFVK